MSVHAPNFSGKIPIFVFEMGNPCRQDGCPDKNINIEVHF